MVYNQLSKIQLARLLGFIAIVFTFLFSLTNESFAETTIVDVTDKELLGEIALVPNSEEDQSAKLTAIIAKYRYNDPEILTFPPGVFILDKDITMRNNISLKVVRKHQQLLKILLISEFSGGKQRLAGIAILPLQISFLMV